ncbi:MAG: hypothetical protein FWB93_06790 [Oscillospiraceae bacterium]|nr:hypothetical protein [Oscillospiraceae bacterium]
MKDNYDFSDAIKNPFAGKFNGKYTVTVHYDFSGTSETKTIDIKEKPKTQKGYTHEQNQSSTLH